MSKNIKLNSSQALDIIQALTVKLTNLESDMNDSFFPVCEIDKEEAKRIKATIKVLDSAFWTEEGELK